MGLFLNIFLKLSMTETSHPVKVHDVEVNP